MFKAIAPLIPQTNDRNSYQIKQRSPISIRNTKCLKRSPSHSQNQRSHLIPNQTMIAYFFRHAKCSKRSPTHSQNQRSQLTSNQTTIAYFYQTH
ncbi:hypothetical protein [Pseudanabaena minima]|uniref:hypothetical protein n=1 Tax=Pseudanabaena minima TaxID=890415 RepID=UPI003DA8BD91